MKKKEANHDRGICYKTEELANSCLNEVFSYKKGIDFYFLCVNAMSISCKCIADFIGKFFI